MYAIRVMIRLSQSNYFVPTKATVSWNYITITWHIKSNYICVTPAAMQLILKAARSTQRSNRFECWMCAATHTTMTAAWNPNRLAGHGRLRVAGWVMRFPTEIIWLRNAGLQPPCVIWLQRRIDWLESLDSATNIWRFAKRDHMSPNIILHCSDHNEIRDPNNPFKPFWRSHWNLSSRSLFGPRMDKTHSSDLTLFAARGENSCNLHTPLLSRIRVLNIRRSREQREWCKTICYYQSQLTVPQKLLLYA